MAECEVCGTIVEPGDVVAVEHHSQPHYFCSTFHRDQWRAEAEQRDLADEAREQAGAMKVKATMKATGSKVTAEEMAARKAAEEAAAPAEDATDPGTPTPRPTRRRRKKA